MPNDWQNAIICPVHKKGDLTYCTNYRGIALLDVAYKILALILREKLNRYSDNKIGEYQGGFRKGRSTIDQIATLKQIQSSSYEQNLPLHMLFIDYKQAYDSIDRNKIYSALGKMAVPQKIINLIQMSLKYTSNKVAVEGRLSKRFEVNKGLRQEDPLSTALFNLVLENILREAKIHTKGLVYHNRHQIIAYADDITLVTRTKDELNKIFNEIERHSKMYGLVINEEKTKYMAMRTDEEGKGKHLVLKGDQAKVYKFERVEQFVYLGVIITTNSAEDTEIDQRIVKGNKAMGSLMKMLKSKLISRQTKMRVYSTVIRASVLYGSELWILNRNNAAKLEIWERKILRRILGGVRQEDGQWRRRTNMEVMDIYQRPSITQVVRAQRVRWLGHVYRMAPERITRKALLEGYGGKRNRGRPRRKWLQAVKEDLEKLGVHNWESQARDRKKWQMIAKKIEAMSLGL
nr:unnamed protein product [Callosobruchus chinensis]